MISPRSEHLVKAALCSTLAFSAAQACGPEFSPDTFVRSTRPDVPAQFVRGKLGLLQPGFARADLLVAYRYLNGGTLDSTEQKAWIPTYSLSELWYEEQDREPAQAIPAPETPIARWVLARDAFPDAPSGPIGQEGAIEVQTQEGFHYENHFLNCADDAFRNATETLQARAKEWGKTSPYLVDWLHGQDAVFGNCSAGAAAPAPAPAGSPALLVEDRAYQTAAAHFYSRAFPVAAGEFRAISEDRTSPWQPIAGYLAARVLIRQAFFARPVAQAPADYDPAIMRSAEEQLRGYLAGKPAPEWRSAAEKQLALIRIRLEPEQRTRELASLVGGPGHDANYAQDFQDLLWIAAQKTPDGLRAGLEPYLYEQVPDEANGDATRSMTEQEAERAAAVARQVAFEGSAPERAFAPILDWTLTFESLSAVAPQHALEQWRSTHGLPWLVAALTLAPGDTHPAADLLSAAGSIPLDSPAGETIAYHRARLLLATGHVAEARAALAALSLYLQQVPARDREPSTMNAVRGLEMLAAPNTADFLSFAPRSLLVASSEEHSSVLECQEAMKHPTRHYNCVARVDPDQLDTDAARIFNDQAPLSLWLLAAQSDSLSLQLRTALAEEGWTRSILLGEKTRAASFLALLPESLREQATAGGSSLAPWMTLARNPGLRPYMNAGTQRAYSFDFVESYRDNWCYTSDRVAVASPPAAFLSPPERQEGAEQAQRIKSIRSLDVGLRIMHEVEADPGDPHAAEALFLILRMIRYGCTDQQAPEVLQLRRDAARLLRQRYPTSPWTQKAAPFVG